VFNVIYQQFIAMYDSGCQICCKCPDSSRVVTSQHTEVTYRR